MSEIAASAPPVRDSYDRAASPAPRGWDDDRYGKRPPSGKFEGAGRNYPARDASYRDVPAEGPPEDMPRRPMVAPKAEPNQVLGVFGLSIRTRERDLEDEFMRYGDVDKVIIVYDQRVSCAERNRAYNGQTDRSRGFGFITMRTVEDAERCIEKLNGLSLHGRNIRVDYSATQKPHSSTPGQYMGTKRPPRDDRYSRGGGGGRYDDRRNDRRGYDDRRDYHDRQPRATPAASGYEGRDRYRDSYAAPRGDDPYEGRSRRDNYEYSSKHDKYDKYDDYDYDRRSSRRGRYSASPGRAREYEALPPPEAPRY
ncbi:hypothetical protein L204_103893 [Cryptococcus depauperatus]